MGYRLALVSADAHSALHSGGEFGWRSGTGKWPAYRIDSLPAVLNMGPGSPVGVEFGYGAKFPAKYQRALFCLDWSYGTIYAVQITPEGASYTGTRETFLARTPLPLTDAAIGPDGALYFTTGGRNVQSELYRVTYVGPESTAPVDARDHRYADLRALRHKIEAYQASVDNPGEAASTLIPLLAHPDRFIRYTARVSLEKIEPRYWQDKVLSAEGARHADRRRGGFGPNGRFARAAEAVGGARSTRFWPAFRQAAVGCPAGLVAGVHSLGCSGGRRGGKVAQKFDRFFPATSAALLNRFDRDDVNRELCDMLVFLKSPGIVAKTIALLKETTLALPEPANAAELAELTSRNPGTGNAVMASLKNPPEVQKIAYAFSLRNLHAGWTPDERIFYFSWLRDAAQRQGGHSYELYLRNIAQEAYDNASEADRLAVDAAGVRGVMVGPELPPAIGPGRQYSIDDLVALSAEHPKGRNFENGKRAYAAARCVVCHRFNGEGGSTGPDLTQAAGRFTLRDLAESLVEPNKVISDQYRATVIETGDGRSYVGRIIGSRPDSITLLTDPEVATKWVSIATVNIENREPSPVSLMPASLLAPLNTTEVLDLLAYLLSRGNPQDPMFNPN